MNLNSNFEDVKRRADLYDCIAEMIRSTSATLPLPEEQEVAVSAGIRISVIDRRVVCNGRVLDLARKPLTLRLFKAFCSAPGHKMTREEVVDLIYGSAGSKIVENRSRRYVDSLHNNVTKLISRTRIQASAYLSQGMPKGAEWFVYSQEQRSWLLYRL